MDFIWILVAFVFGFAAKQLGLPPMVGYLVAGFGLHAWGMESSDTLELLADGGITLLLFTIGLKINSRDLLHPAIFGTAIGHMLIWTVLTGLLLYVMTVFIGSSLFNLDWRTIALISFALCFSSTVCAAKVLEEKGELKTTHGKIAIGVLVIQDIAAVIFLVVALGKLPSPWALALLLLIPLRPLLGRLLEMSGHGELLSLVGFFLAFGAFELFSAVDLKGDLGALIMGMLLGAHPKSAELYKALMGFKDLFLIGFFLAIGLTAVPSPDTIMLALFLTVLLPLKFMLFFMLFYLLNLRARTAFLSSLSLMNFSEFGLIVAFICVEHQWLSPDWLVAIALAVAISFIISSYVFKSEHHLFTRHKDLISRFQRQQAVDRSRPSLPPTAEILIVGMGRVGTGSYDSMSEDLGDRVWGVEADSDRVDVHRGKNRRVILADAEDIEFWEQLDLDRIKLVMLAMPSIDDMINVVDQLKLTRYRGRIAGITRYDDEGQALLERGADSVFGYFSNVGAGYAEEGKRLLQESR